MDISAVDIAIGLNLILDIIDRVESRTGVELTPETIADYISQRKLVRDQLNMEAGVTK